MTLWQTMDSAPRDGSSVLLLGRTGIMETGYWFDDGTSWVTRDGCTDLERTGVWFSGGGWFQPDEVSFWAPLPPPPPGFVAEPAPALDEDE